MQAVNDVFKAANEDNDARMWRYARDSFWGRRPWQHHGRLAEAACSRYDQYSTGDQLYAAQVYLTNMANLFSNNTAQDNRSKGDYSTRYYNKEGSMYGAITQYAADIIAAVARARVQWEQNSVEAGEQYRRLKKVYTALYHLALQFGDEEGAAAYTELENEAAKMTGACDDRAAPILNTRRRIFFAFCCEYSEDNDTLRTLSPDLVEYIGKMIYPMSSTKSEDIRKMI